MDQRIFQGLSKLSEQRVTAVTRLKLSNGARGIDSAHSPILPGGKRKCAAPLLLQGLLGSEKSPRNRVVDGGMQGIDAARQQAVVRVEGDVLYEIAQIPAAAGDVGIGGAAERLALDRCTFLPQPPCQCAAHSL